MCNSFMTGFDIATASGPLCEEPMLGAIFLIESVEPVNTILPKEEGGEKKEEEKGGSDA